VSGQPALRQAAIDSAKTSEYTPFELNGEPHAITTTNNVTFTLAGN
jgi:hypothetical protein